MKPVVITVKKNQNVKIALDATLLNTAFLKNKYQKSNLETLMRKVAENVIGKREGGILLPSLDGLYEYGQSTLPSKTEAHCNLQSIGCAMTCTYVFKTEFYGLTTMPPEFQNVRDGRQSREGRQNVRDGRKSFSRIQ